MAALSQTLNVYRSTAILQFSFPNSKLKQPRFSIPSSRFQPIICSSSNVQPKKHSSSSSTKNKNKNLTNNDNKKKKKNNNNSKNNVEIAESNSNSISISKSSAPPHVPTPLPKPPAGFVVDDTGKLLSCSSTDQVATLVDPANNLPLECVIRRVFTSSRGDECMLLCPLDMPVQILQSTGDGWLEVSFSFIVVATLNLDIATQVTLVNALKQFEVSYEELESLLPAAAFAFAKLRMHLVYSGHLSDEDIAVSLFYSLHKPNHISLLHRLSRETGVLFKMKLLAYVKDGNDDGLATESLEITRFNHDGSHYMIYTPSDPLLFVAVKDQNGMLQIADDELLEDPAVISAIDEETEFNALVEEEEAHLDSLLAAE
ncbi:hypothetical protein TSUD_303750 [Trifolium subterraneum]|uniref:Uncharacterized protein n=1 Tax=Trifolium subterraneum TaxID=3900 RepID=A0A2Z6LNA0_TRISU|nr:hypothetical protein TSUD_303750 [Trifolium subterraneum]